MPCEVRNPYWSVPVALSERSRARLVSQPPEHETDGDPCDRADCRQIDSHRSAKCDINATRKDQANGQDLDKVSLAQVPRRGTKFCKFVGVRRHCLNDLKLGHLCRFADRAPSRRNALAGLNVTHHLAAPTRAEDRNIFGRTPATARAPLEAGLPGEC